MTAKRRLTPAVHPDRLLRPSFPFCEDFQICTACTNNQDLLISACSLPNTAKCFTRITGLILKTKQLFLALFCRGENGGWENSAMGSRSHGHPGNGGSEIQRRVVGLLNLKKLLRHWVLARLVIQWFAPNHLGEVSFLPRQTLTVYLKNEMLPMPAPSYCEETWDYVPYRLYISGQCYQ